MGGRSIARAAMEGRVVFGRKFIGMAETIYGLVFVLFIIFLPAGIYGLLARLLARRAAGAGA